MEEKRILVSIIVPCYNAEKYIEEMFLSLENQVFQCFEVIIIDDGSTDRTEEIVRKFITRNKLLIRYCKQKNAGVSNARNNGIRKAIGAYLLFLDADDIYSVYTIKILYKYIAPDTVTFCKITRKLSKCNVTYVEDMESINSVIDKQRLVDIFLYRTPKVNFQSIIYEKEILDINQIYFSEDMKYGEDNEFMWKYIAHAKCGNLIKFPLYGYRISDMSATQKKTKRVIDAERSIVRAVTYVKKWDLTVAEKLEKYMVPRTKLMVAKDLARQSNKQAFLTYCKNYSRDDYNNIKIFGRSRTEKFANYLLVNGKLLFYMFINCYYFLRKIFS